MRRAKRFRLWRQFDLVSRAEYLAALRRCSTTSAPSSRGSSSLRLRHTDYHHGCQHLPAWPGTPTPPTSPKPDRPAPAARPIGGGTALLPAVAGCRPDAGRLAGRRRGLRFDLDERRPRPRRRPCRLSARAAPPAQNSLRRRTRRSGTGFAGIAVPERPGWPLDAPCSSATRRRLMAKPAAKRHRWDAVAAGIGLDLVFSVFAGIGSIKIAPDHAGLSSGPGPHPLQPQPGRVRWSALAGLLGGAVCRLTPWSSGSRLEPLVLGRRQPPPDMPLMGGRRRRSAWAVVFPAVDAGGRGGHAGPRRLAGL